MFLRQLGRRIYILHSYRDGRGKVCQRRLAHFADAAGLERQLAALPNRCQDIGKEALPELREKAEALLVDLKIKSTGGSERVRRTIRALLTLLAEEDEEVLQEVADDLELLQVRLGQPLQATDQSEEILRRQALEARSQLSPRRRRLDSTEPKAGPLIDSTNRLAKFLTSQDRLLESADIWKQRVNLCPNEYARLAYGAVLHKLGRRQEALEQYSRAPKTSAYRHYNSAAALWQEDRPDEALIHLLRGLTRAPQVIEALKRSEDGKPVWLGGEYWQEFGDLWTTEGRRFAVGACSQLIVQWRLRQALERGVQPRNLVPVRSRPKLLDQALTATRNFRSQFENLRQSLIDLGVGLERRRGVGCRPPEPGGHT